ncbi:MAG: hypothetical protein QY306_10520 [Anaerolineales bacterium]|nr:MAG: hypothetical protein QY306_10520 [Anaerolineales bacterium]
MKQRTVRINVAWVAIVLAALACNIPSSSTEVPTTQPPATELVAVIDTATSPPPTEIPIQHQVFPVNLPENRSGHAGDYDSSVTASEKKANGGDRFTFERFERPFNSNTMDIYYPELDIVDTFVYEDATWMYGTIQVVDRSAVNVSPYRFAMQVDIEADGKGDFLVTALNPPSTDWTTNGVQVFQDANSDVGDLTAMFTDENATDGDGFETLVFDQGKGNDPDVAWARVSPQNPNIVELAVKRSTFNNTAIYMVNMWTGHGSLDPALFDFSDHFTHEQAGAADPELPNFYPIKAVSELDNSCRMAVGFQPKGSEPGICPLLAPPKAEGPSCQPTMTEINYCLQVGGTWNYTTCQCDIPVIP